MMMTPGITPAGEGDGGVVWNILGQTYKPKQLSEACFTFETLFPDGTFVPPHIHTTQDEFIYLLEGKFEFLLDGQTVHAKPGDLIRLPMGMPHGIFNKSGADVKALFYVSPSRKLYELFSRIHNLSDPNEVVRISAECEVEFLPPPG
ncbi:cupin domain-containing protein [Sabulicella glaciei]|uniref:Cupin domain-containing protein n=1 Tax=Sabulicella glaciei TaxID=2984948 RepID=A0ABT3NWL4_9PROT|nr:cupin domain-containing protein [Roseococcus sp. MDT2-1-1]MCW8086564.1 cupin domain-containing protein [Roseococcus sp. MDT2-1-1]